MAAKNQAGREEHKNPWLRGDVLALIGIILTLAGIVIGAIVQIEPARVGCFVHLTPCDSAPPSIPGPPVFVDVAGDPNMPFPVGRPAAHAVGDRYPSLETSLPTIVNRGKPVAVEVTGVDFYANTTVEMHWYRPDGDEYLVGGGNETDERGLFSEALLWQPLQSRGVAGNNGPWKLVVQDNTSGQSAVTQINVTSDKQTPPPSSWDMSGYGGLKPLGRYGANVATGGRLCTGDGAFGEISVKGFMPGGQIQIDFLRPDGKRLESIQDTADARGEILYLHSYWKTNNCKSAMQFIYKVVVTELDNGWQAKGDMFLSTL